VAAVVKAQVAAATRAVRSAPPKRVANAGSDTSWHEF
jgi:methyl-accepting chemotaxis protein